MAVNASLSALSRCAKLRTGRGNLNPRRSAVVSTEARDRSVTRALPLFLISLAVVAADQLTKYLVRAHMDLGQSIPHTGFVRLTYATNTGGADGLFGNQTFLLALAAIAIVALVLYLRYLPPSSRLLKVALGLLLGGAVGNLIDRVRLGEVTDFIDVGAWPVFNLADSAIVVGTVLIVYYLLFEAPVRAR
jgi:signal peptidase II